MRPQGFDFARGETLLSKGRVIGARALALIAAANQAFVEVCQRPKIHILATGAELRGPGHASKPEHVVASNGLALQALLNKGAQMPKIRAL